MRTADENVRLRAVELPFEIRRFPGDRLLNKNYTVARGETGEQMLRTLVDEVPAEVGKRNDCGDKWHSFLLLVVKTASAVAPAQEGGVLLPPNVHLFSQCAESCKFPGFSSLQPLLDDCRKVEWRAVGLGEHGLRFGIAATHRSG